MKISAFTKRLGVMALVLGVAVGCATAQEEEMADACEGISPEVQAAIDEAQSAVDDARAMGAEWTEAQDLVGQATSAGRDCRDNEALRLAREAEMTAQDAIDAYRAAQQEEPMEEADRSYTVSRGDTLWGISGRSVGYSDPYQWPLIYRANTDIVEDADLIYPGQDLTIEANPSGRAVDAAIEHAKTRGEWSLGRVEDSDRRYLNRWGM